MRITILQTDIAWADVQENIRRAEALMLQAGPAADLYVLPEMWATGFAVEPQGVAEDEDQSVALAWMKRQAAQRHCAFSGSLAVRLADGTYRNRHYFVTPQTVVHYDKRHLFTHGHEDQHYTAGEKAVVAEWCSMRLLLQTCYDLRFPVFARYGRAGEYDAIIYAANWPAKRNEAWQVLTRARAMENQCLVIAVNRTGDDPNCHYAGDSAIITPLGRYVGHCSDMPGWASYEVTAEDIAQVRSRFRVLDDRDR